jgi:hypothetical protein
MILVKLTGGLGNQLFQYSLGRRLSIEHNEPLFIDTSWYATQSLRSYRLTHFNIQAEQATSTQIRRFTSKNVFYRLQRVLINRFLPEARHWHTLREKTSFVFDETIVKHTGNLLLRGYWQNHRYFAPVADIIRDDLTIIPSPSPPNQQMLDHITSVNAVSLHIRRGDYVHNPHTNAVHGLIPLDYYHRASSLIAEQIEHPHFFIFSDEPVWAVKNLDLSYNTTIVDINDVNTDYEDLRLMMQCKHHIIANSSFSWWGAWLAPSVDKIVITPSRWQTARQLSSDDDMMLPSWTRLKI